VGAKLTVSAIGTSEGNDGGGLSRNIDKTAPWLNAPDHHDTPVAQRLKPAMRGLNATGRAVTRLSCTRQPALIPYAITA
jgi:hypothetical protein